MRAVSGARPLSALDTGDPLINVGVAHLHMKTALAVYECEADNQSSHFLLGVSYGSREELG